MHSVHVDQAPAQFSSSPADAAPLPSQSSPPPQPPPRRTSHNNLHTLPPLITTSTPRTNIPLYSGTRSAANSRLSLTKSIRSRPQSALPTALDLSYTHVRDFAYPSTDPFHYGHYPEVESVATTPASSSWRSETTYSRGGGKQRPDPSLALPLPLPSTSFGDGPPWAEDEDLHSPIVTSARHRKAKSSAGDSDDRRGRPPTRDTHAPSTLATSRQDASIDEPSYYDDPSHYSPPDDSYFPASSRAYDPSFPSSYHPTTHPPDSYLDDPGAASSSDEEGDESRYSKDYQFTIASPDEEMHGKAVALFDFARENENELPLVEGQVIWVSYRHGQGWLVAQDPKSGESGLVPEEYVQLVAGIEGGLSVLNGQDASPVVPAASPAAGIDDDASAASPSPVLASQPHYTPVRSHFSTSSKDLQPWGGQAGHAPNPATTGTEPQTHLQARADVPDERGPMPTTVEEQEAAEVSHAHVHVPVDVHDAAVATPQKQDGQEGVGGGGRQSKDETSGAGGEGGHGSSSIGGTTGESGSAAVGEEAER